MATLTLYNFETFDPVRRRWEKAERMGTLEAIAAIGGVPLRSSALVIESDKVGPDGMVSLPKHVLDSET